MQLNTRIMIDLTRKLIFTHPPKCAGTTIEGLFGWHLSKCMGENKLFCSADYPKWKHATFDEHLSHLQSIGEDHSRYFVFSCIRNPWDRAVSWYFHRKIIAVAAYKKNNPNQEIPNNLKKIQHSTFEDFIKNEHYRAKNGGFNALSTRPFILSNLGRKPDFIIRHENFLDGMQFVADKFGLDATTAVSFNANARPKEPHYREYYLNDQSITLVAEMARDSIEDFGYGF